jgi:tRNA(Ile)-lysidine synthase
MANSRKSCSLNNQDKVQQAFERALGALLARVCASAAESRPPIAVAYSGGLDSTVLLYLASRYATAHALPVYAFHVHHGLSSNADDWVEHCRLQSDRFGVPLEICHVLVSDAEKRGVEEAARIARYNALGDLCRRKGVSLLLTAHHRDDQAETVFLQLMRGAGLPGLSGMPSFQAQHELSGPDIALGRPLLGISRGELEQIALHCDLQHVSDESNTDVRYRRNAFRHDIAPVIEMHFPGFSELVSRAALHARTAQSLLSELAMIDYEACKSDRHTDALDLEKMCGLSAQRLENLLRHWLYEHRVQLPSTARLTEIRTQMLGAASDKHPVFDFEAARLHRIGNRLELHPNLGAPPSEPIILEWHGEPELALPQWHGRLVFEKTAGPGIDAEKLRRGILTLRPRVGQERLRPAPNRPSKSLKHLFQESLIAAWRRAWLPLLYLDDDLVFVAGLGMDARHVTQGESVALRWEGA